MEIVLDIIDQLIFQVQYELRCEIDIPKLTTVDLPHSFEYIKSKSINRMKYMNE